MKKIVIVLLLLFVQTIVIAQTKSVKEYQEETEILWDKKKYVEAFKIITDAIKQYPDTFDLYNQRGNMFSAAQMHEDAIMDFSIAINKSKNASNKYKSNLYSNIGASRMNIRDFDLSYKDIKYAILLDSTNTAAYVNLSALCSMTNKPEEAISSLLVVVKLDSTYAPAYTNLGFTYLTQKEYKKAIYYLDKSIQLLPDEGFAYSNRSFCKMKLGDLKGAMTDIETSIKLNPVNSYAYKNRALIKIENKNIKGACVDLNKALELKYTERYGNEVENLLKEYCK
jgi:tetratricopeptide (TPR) repeat protein